MPPVGRPRTTTRTGSRAPTQELGVPDLGLGGYGVVGTPLSPLAAGGGPWRMFVDEWEYVPELRWPWNIRVFDQMRTDSQLAGLLTAVMWGICQLRFVVDPNGCPAGMVKEIATDLNLPVLGEDDKPRGRMRNRFSHSKHIVQAMLSAIYGHEYFNIYGDIIDQKWRLKALAPRMPHTIRQINVADNGDLVSICQWAPIGWNFQTGAPGAFALGPEIPVDNLVPYIFGQEGASMVGRSMLRDVYKDWLIKDRDLRIEAINHERAGGVPYAVGAPGMSVDEISDLDQMMRHFRIGETAGGALPYGSELNIAKGTGSDVDKTIKRIDESMARRFLLQLVNLAQGGQHVGSYSLSETFEDFFLVGQRQIAQWYCDTTTEQVIEKIVDWNYGEDTELTPRITWERSTEDSLGTEQLALLVQRGIIIVDEETEDWVRYRNLMPKRKGPRPEITPAGPRQPTEQMAQRQPQETGVTDAPVEPTATVTASTEAGSAGAVLPPLVDPAIRQHWWNRGRRRAGG